MWSRARASSITTIFEPTPDAGEGLITATYAAHPEGTLLVQRELYPSKEVLDGAIASGMERGFRETLEQLAALLPELAEPRPLGTREGG